MPVLCEHCGELRDEQAIRAALAGMQVGDLVSPSCVHARVDIAALLAALDAERARAERAEAALVELAQAAAPHCRSEYASDEEAHALKCALAATPAALAANVRGRVLREAGERALTQYRNGMRGERTWVEVDSWLRALAGEAGR